MPLEDNHEDDAKLASVIKQLPSLSLEEFNDKLNHFIFSKQVAAGVAVISDHSSRINSFSSPFLRLPEKCLSNNPNDSNIEMVIGVIFGTTRTGQSIKTLIEQLEDANKLEAIIFLEESTSFYYTNITNHIEKYPTVKFFYPMVREVSIPLGKLDLVLHSFVPRDVTKYVLNVTPECAASTDLDILDLEFSEYVEQVKIEFPVSEDQQSIGIRSLTAPNLKFLKIGNEADKQSGDYQTPILISRVGKVDIKNLQDFQLLNVTFNKTEEKSTTYDFSFLKQLERGSFSIHADCKNTSVYLFNSFKDNLRVLEVFNCPEILQTVRSVELSNLKFLLLEYCDEDDMESTDEKVEEYFEAINEMNLPSLSSISLRTIQLADLVPLKRLTRYASTIKELTWVYEAYGEKLSDFNSQLNSLSEWLPNLECLILRMNGNGVEKFEGVPPFTLKNIRLYVENFYYFARDWASELYLKNLDAPYLLDLVVINEKDVVTADADYRFININAPKLERLEILTDSQVTITPSDLMRFPELKIFISDSWTDQELKLGNDKLEVLEFSVSALQLEGNLPALKKLICDNATRKILEQHNVDVSSWKERSRFQATISRKPEVDQEMDKCIGSFFANNRNSFLYFL